MLHMLRIEQDEKPLSCSVNEEGRFSILVPGRIRPTASGRCSKHEMVLIQALSHETLSIPPHVEAMTKPRDPVRQCWGCNSRGSAVLGLAETISRNDPRADANYDHGEEALNKCILIYNE